jgi:hypothetical protein
MQFLKLARERMKALSMNDEMLKRGVNVGFSGGEKKRNEILQTALLQPKLAILDETDSGLDIDALKIAGRWRECHARAESPRRWSITHYQRLLDYIVPDRRACADRRAHCALGRAGIGEGAGSAGLRGAPSRRRRDGGSPDQARQASSRAIRASRIICRARGWLGLPRCAPMRGACGGAWLSTRRVEAWNTRIFRQWRRLVCRAAHGCLRGQPEPAKAARSGPGGVRRMGAFALIFRR